MGLTNVGAAEMMRAAAGTAIPTAWNNANAHIGVGENTGAFAITQTNLLGATLTRKAMDATYPTVSPGSGAAPPLTLTYRSTFATTDANIAWQEWGVFNASSAGNMLNRFVQSLGTKTSAQSWQFTVTLTFVPS